jgi:tRNA(adenine34) deaminase
MNNDEKFMQVAIEEAKNAKENGSPPISSIMVKDGKVIAKGWSSVGKDLDPSGHNDTNCIRQTCKNLNSLDLSNCTMFSTIEPCAMCLSCAAWAGLRNIIFGAYQEDIAGNSYLLTGYHAETQAKLYKLDGKTMNVKGGVLRDECSKLMKNYKNWIPAK